MSGLLPGLALVPVMPSSLEGGGGTTLWGVGGTALCHPSGVVSGALRRPGHSLLCLRTHGDAAEGCKQKEAGILTQIIKMRKAPPLLISFCQDCPGLAGAFGAVSGGRSWGPSPETARPKPVGKYLLALIL